MSYTSYMDFQYSVFYERTSDRPFLKTNDADLANRNLRRGVFVWDNSKLAEDGTEGDWMES